MVKVIRRILDFWNKIVSNSPVFTYDKFAHGWLHTIIVRSLRSFGIDTMSAIVIAFIFGIIYEFFDLFLHCIILKDVNTNEYSIDSMYDIVWNFVGQVIGGLI